MAREKHASLLANPVAVELGLEEPNGPSVVLAQAMEEIRISVSSGSDDGQEEEEAGAEPNVLYMYFLDACEKMFANEMDAATFEEHMRWFFRTKVRSVYLSFLSLLSFVAFVRGVLSCVRLGSFPLFRVGVIGFYWCLFLSPIAVYRPS